MTTPKAIFDLDDTLCGVWLNGQIQPTAAAYDDCLDRYAYEMMGLGFSEQDARDMQQHVDMAMATSVGFLDKTRFAQSMAIAYESLASEMGKIPDALERQYLYNIGMSVFTDYPYAALEGALDVLDKVRQHYEVIIVTKGEPEEQHKKLRHSGCGGFADEVYVVGKKDDADWEDIYTQIGMTDEIAAISWAIGNSVKADINPPLRRGLNAIHLQEKNGWAFEQAHPETPLPGRLLYTINDISDVLHCMPIGSQVYR